MTPLYELIFATMYNWSGLVIYHTRYLYSSAKDFKNHDLFAFTFLIVFLFLSIWELEATVTIAHYGFSALE